MSRDRPPTGDDGESASDAVQELIAERAKSVEGVVAGGAVVVEVPYPANIDIYRPAVPNDRASPEDLIRLSHTGVSSFGGSESALLGDRIAAVDDDDLSRYVGRCL